MTANWSWWVWVVLLAPAAGFLFQAAFGKPLIDALGIRRGRLALGVIAVLPVALGFVISIYLSAKLAGLGEHERVIISTWFNWIDLQTLRVPFELRVDPLSMTMALIVTGVGALIHIYATGYMGEDRDYPRFFTYMNLFIAFMLILVLANNLAIMFIGWEGVGLCSYLLIGYWYHDIENAKAANKAFIVNRIGDWGMALGIFLIFVVFAENRGVIGPDETRYLSFDVIFPHAQEVLGQYGGLVVTMIPVLLFIGAVGKSAQFPLYLWLPDAMAGPTPVSALIHAATMVTAGIYLVARTHVLFELAPISMLIVACVGAFTAIFAASVAFGQTDIKRVLAYSTVSQLGYMFLACGVGAFATGMFHVATHAFFKALLFLGSGAVIIAMAHNQDLRRFGSLKKYLPITYVTFAAGWLAISGIPPFAGFFSKDEILSKTWFSGQYWAAHWNGFSSQFLYIVGIVTAVMTAGYMTRLFLLTFHGTQERWRESPPDSYPAIHDEHDEHADQHGADERGFYLAEHEVAERVAEEERALHHHELGPAHLPREVGPAMWVPLAALAALSLLGGAILAGFQPISSLLGIETAHLFNNWNEASTGPAVLPHAMFHGAHFHELILVLVSVAAGILGIGYMLRRYAAGLPKDETEMRGLRRSAGMQWFYDLAMYRLFVEWGGRAANGLYRWFDGGVIDGVFVHGSARVVGAFGLLFRRTQTGYARGYAMTMLLGAVVILSYIIYVSSR